MDVVNVKNLTKKFEDETAVDDVTFECREKEFLCFLGRPGAGKTTLLRTIAGLEQPTKGEIYIRGNLVNNVIPSQRDVAMVFQNLALYTGWKVYDNIASPLKATCSTWQIIDGSDSLCSMPRETRVTAGFFPNCSKRGWNPGKGSEWSV